MRLVGSLEARHIELFAILSLSSLFACGGTTRDTPRAEGTGGHGATGGSHDVAMGGAVATGGVPATGGRGDGGGGAGAMGGAVTTGGVSATGGRGDGGRGAGGTGGTHHLECVNPTPVVSADGKDTGFVACASGAVHRAKKVTCPSPVPRPEACNTGCNADSGFCNTACTHDADCVKAPHGYCNSFPSVGFGGAPGCYCDYGCLSDADCAAGSVCECGNPVGVCVSAGDCTTDADCNGRLCLQTYSCAGSSFACQTDQDECMVADDCGPALECVTVPGGTPSHRCFSKQCPIP